MNNLEVPLQVVNVTWFNNIQMKDLTLLMNLNQDTMSIDCRGAVDHCSCYSDTRGVTVSNISRILSCFCSKCLVIVRYKNVIHLWLAVWELSNWILCCILTSSKMPWVDCPEYQLGCMF
jgi:hypothetical protein